MDARGWTLRLRGRTYAQVGSRLRLLLAMAATLALVAPAGASAASTLSITTGNDPTESITTQLGVAGSTDVSNGYLDLTVKPTGGAGCGANPDADSGTFVLRDTVSNGPYSLSENRTFDNAGSYLLCAWLRDRSQSGYPVVTAVNSTITVRIPKLSLSLAAPASVASGTVFQATLTGQAETQRHAYFGAVPDTARGCPANWSAFQAADGHLSIDDILITGGPTSDTQNVQIDGSGVYLLCAYFQRGFSDPVPEATANGAISVNPPCVVPALADHTALAVMKAALAAADCAVGKVTYQASSRIRRGDVITLNPKPATALAPMAPVNVVVSSGAPCIVPSAAGRTLRATKAALRKGDCTVGRVTYRRSLYYSRGRVITLSSRPRTRLSPRATVRIVVSSGRERRH
jgi:hypothetical protein